MVRRNHLPGPILTKHCAVSQSRNQIGRELARIVSNMKLQLNPIPPEYYSLLKNREPISSSDSEPLPLDRFEKGERFHKKQSSGVNPPVSSENKNSGKRLQAGIAELLKRYPDASAERDKVLLRVLGRECCNSKEMAPYKNLLFSQDSVCEELMMANNGMYDTQNHPHNGKTFSEIGDRLNRVEPVLAKIRAMAKPLPQKYWNLVRSTSPKHKKTEVADGKFDYKELYARGFPQFINAIYASDNVALTRDFGAA